MENKTFTDKDMIDVIDGLGSHYIASGKHGNVPLAMEFSVECIAAAVTYLDKRVSINEKLAFISGMRALLREFYLQIASDQLLEKMNESRRLPN